MEDEVKKQGEKKRPEVGKYACRCHQVIDLGVQQARADWDPKPRIHFGFELVNTNEKFSKEDDAELQPFTMSIDFNRYLSQTSALGEFLGKWQPDMIAEGAKVNYMKLCEKKGVLHVEENEGTGKHAGKTFSNINKVTKPDPNMQYPALRNPMVFFELGSEKCGWKEPGGKAEFMPWWDCYMKMMNHGNTFKWILKKIANSNDFYKMVSEAGLSTETDEKGNVSLLSAKDAKQQAQNEAEMAEMDGDGEDEPGF